MLVPKSVLSELCYAGSHPGEEAEGFLVISNAIMGHGRWTVDYRIVMKKDGAFGAYEYSTPATEVQEDQDDTWEYEDEDPVPIADVVPVQVTVTRYVTPAEAEELKEG